ncbi:hypothetical protein HGM15179_015618, partial [Zosterops borbonicus]
AADENRGRSRWNQILPWSRAGLKEQPCMEKQMELCKLPACWILWSISGAEGQLSGNFQ